MRNTLHSRPSPRQTTGITLAALAAIALSIPSLAFAQDRGPHGAGMQGGGPAMHGGQGAMQGAGPGMQGAGPGKPGDSQQTRMSRRTERFMMLYDLNHDGKVTIDEINNDQARIFTAMDIDNDKSLSVDEIRRRGRSLQTFRTTTLFDLLDANGDGKLSLDEIQGPSKRWFKRYDANGDGVLEASEVPSRRDHRSRHR